MSKRDREAVHRGLDHVFGSEGSDLLGSVIQSDRSRAGRRRPAKPGDSISPAEKAGPSYDEKTSQHVIGEYDNTADQQPDTTTSRQAGKPASRPAIGQADRLPESAPGAVPKRTHPMKQKRVSEPTDLVACRIAEGRRLADTPTTTVTLRLPRGLNDWLDEYVHRAWPERIRKQELVAEALRLLLARRGRPGEPVLDTELLPEDER